MKNGIWGRALLGVAALCLVASVAAAKGKDAIVGNWDLDVAKSSVSGAAMFKSGHVAATAVKGGYHAVVDLVLASGAPIHYEYDALDDGSSATVSGSTYFDSATVLRVGHNTVIRTERRGGKVVGVTTIEIAKDGKTFASSSKGTGSDGKPFSRALSWTRSKKK